MTSAQSEDENLSRLQCGGDFVNCSLLVNRGQSNFFLFYFMSHVVPVLSPLIAVATQQIEVLFWHDWKKLERKRKNLIRLGISKGQAYAWSRTRMGGWAVAQSPILVTTITLKRLMQRGYESMLSYYEKVSPQFNEPLYTRPVRTVV